MATTAFGVVPARHDFKMTQGQTWLRTLTIQVDDDGFDVAGITARMQVREDYVAEAVALEFTTADGSIVLTELPDAVTATLTATDEETAALETGPYVYDLEFEYSDGTVDNWFGGIITVHPEATRG